MLAILKGFTIPVVLGTTGLVVGGGYGLISYLGNSKNKNLFIDDKEEQDIWKKLKLAAEYINRNSKNDNNLNCEYLLLAENIEKTREIPQDNCSKFLRDVGGNNSQDWPAIGLKAKEEKFEEALKKYFFSSGSEDSSKYEKLDQDWSYGHLTCINKKDNAGRIFVGCTESSKPEEDLSKSSQDDSEREMTN